MDIKAPLGVLVTRPLPQSQRIAKVLAQSSMTLLQPVIFPVIEIGEPENLSDFHHSLGKLSEVALVILVSVSAVEAFCRGLDHEGIALPSSLEVAVLGKKSAQLCQDLGLKVDYLPSDTINSEGLLRSLANKRWTGKKVVIYRGQDGRELLSEQLGNWGASVRYIQAYQRALTQVSPNRIIDKWKRGDIQLVLVTSESIVDGLFDLLGPLNITLFEQTPVITISRRIEQYCRHRGVASKTWVASSPGDNDVLTCIEHAARELLMV